MKKRKWEADLGSGLLNWIRDHNRYCIGMLMKGMAIIQYRGMAKNGLLSGYLLHIILHLLGIHHYHYLLLRHRCFLRWFDVAHCTAAYSSRHEVNYYKRCHPTNCLHVRKRQKGVEASRRQERKNIKTFFRWSDYYAISITKCVSSVCCHLLMNFRTNSIQAARS